MNKDHQELSDLIQTCLDGRATDEQVALLNARLRSDAAARDLYLQLADTHSCLAVDESLWVEGVADSRILDFPARERGKRWLNWSPLTAAAAGLVFGMFCTSAVFAYVQPKLPAGMTRLLPLADADFESGLQIPAQGIPARAGAWSGDFSRVVAAENGITPKQGKRMVRLLRSDNELSPKNGRSYVGSVAQVIDLRPLQAELAGEDQLVELSAQFNSITLPPGAPYEFAVKAAAFRGDIADAPRLWEAREAGVSRSNLSIGTDTDVATWQRVAVPLVVPPDADFLVIECAVVLKGSQVEQGAAEFPGHYVDQVQVRIGGSANALAAASSAD